MANINSHHAMQSIDSNTDFSQYLNQRSNLYTQMNERFDRSYFPNNQKPEREDVKSEKQFSYDPLLISQPHPIVKYPEGINYYKTYNYDLYNIQYHHISIDSWGNVPSDESPYSYMWSTLESFEPEQFSKIHLYNKHSKNRNIDFFWVIFLIINTLATFLVFGYLIYKFKMKYKPQNNCFHDEIDSAPLCIQQIFIAAGVGASIGLIFNIIHIVCSTFAPKIYIKDSIWLCVVVSFLCVILLVIKGNYIAFSFPILTLLFSVCFFCCMKKYMSFSVTVLTVATKLFWNYPSIILLISADIFFELIFGLTFSLSIFFVEFTSTSRFIYIFLCFSYLWSSSTFCCLTYMTISSLTSTWYFLKGTVFYPKNPVWESFSHICRRSFGSASLGGFLLSFIKILEFLANSENICCSCTSSFSLDESVDSVNNGEIDEQQKNRPEKSLLCIFKCLSICILKIFDACIPFINQYALVYCAIFEIPFKEGCRRWAELSCRKFCNLLFDGCCIKTAMFFNCLIWTCGSVSFGLGISLYFFKDFFDGISVSPNVYFSIFAFIFTFSFFNEFTRPFSGFSDSIMVCFSEAPDKLKASSNGLYERMRLFYQKRLDEMVQNSYD